MTKAPNPLASLADQVTSVPSDRYRRDVPWADVVIDGRFRSHIQAHPLPLHLGVESREAFVHVPLEGSVGTSDGGYGYGVSPGLTISGYVIHAEAHFDPLAADSGDAQYATGAVIICLEFPDGFTGALVTSFRPRLYDFCPEPRVAIWDAYATKPFDGFGDTLGDPDSMVEHTARFERGTWVMARTWRTAACDPDTWFAGRPFVVREESAASWSPDEEHNAAFLLNDYASHGFTSRPNGDAFAHKTTDWDFLVEAAGMGFDLNDERSQEWLATAQSEQWDVIHGLNIVRMAARDGWLPGGFKALQPKAIMDQLWDRVEANNSATGSTFLELWNEAVGYRTWMRHCDRNGYVASLYLMAGISLSEARQLRVEGAEPDIATLETLVGLLQPA